MNLAHLYVLPTKGSRHREHSPQQRREFQLHNGDLDRENQFSSESNLTGSISSGTAASRRAAPDSTVGLCLLPAFPVSSYMWLPLLQYFPDRPVVALSHPGFSGEVDPEVQPSISNYALATAEVLTKYPQTQRWVLVGNSIGGYVVQHLACQVPEKIAALALIGTNGTADDQSKVAQRRSIAQRARELARAQNDSLDTKSNQLEQFQQGILALVAESRSALARAQLSHLSAGITFSGIAWGQEAMANRPEMLTRLETMSIPALVMRGSLDQQSSAQDAAALGRALNCEVIEVSGAGHLLPWENPVAVAEAILQLLGRINRV